MTIMASAGKAGGGEEDGSVCVGEEDGEFSRRHMDRQRRRRRDGIIITDL